MNKPVYGYDYLVYEDGRVFSNKSNSFLKPRVTSSGYLFVNLHRNKTVRSFKIHSLVASHFLQKPENANLYSVRHIDGNILNNIVTNLEWYEPSSSNEDFQLYRTYSNYVCRYKDVSGEFKTKYFSISKYGNYKAEVLATEFLNEIQSPYQSED